MAVNQKYYLKWLLQNNNDIHYSFLFSLMILYIIQNFSYTKPRNKLDTLFLFRIIILNSFKHNIIISDINFLLGLIITCFENYSHWFTSLKVTLIPFAFNTCNFWSFFFHAYILSQNHKCEKTQKVIFDVVLTDGGFYKSIFRFR